MKILKFIEDWKSNIFLVLVLAVLSITVIYLGINFISKWGVHKESYEKMIKAREEYNRFMISQKELPSNKLIAEYEAHAKEIRQIYDEIYKNFSRTKDQTDTALSALGYKQKLLLTQKEFQEKAKNKEMFIPVDLGFKELMGDKIPAEASIPLLTLQLDLVSMFMDLFIESGVERVENIIKRDYIKDPKYKTKLLFTFNFKTETQSLVKFLNFIQSRKEILVVENLSINTIPLDKFRLENKMGYLLEVSLDVLYIEL